MVRFVSPHRRQGRFTSACGNLSPARASAVMAHRGLDFTNQFPWPKFRCLYQYRGCAWDSRAERNAAFRPLPPSHVSVSTLFSLSSAPTAYLHHFVDNVQPVTLILGFRQSRVQYSLVEPCLVVWIYISFRGSAVRLKRQIGTYSLPCTRGIGDRA